MSLQNSAGGISLIVGGNSSSTTYSGILSGSGSLTKTNGGVLVLTASNSYLGGTTISGGTLQLGDGTGGHDGSLAGSMTNNSAPVYDLTGSQNYSGGISGNGTLTKVGSGLLLLSGNNGYTGHTTVSGGTLALAAATALPGYSSTSVCSLSVTGGATLALDLAGTGTGWTAANFTSFLTSANTSGFFAGSALGLDSTSASFTCGNSLVGNMGLTKLGTNTVTLTGANGYNGHTTVGMGTLEVANIGALPSYSSTSDFITVNNGATLALNVGTGGWTAANAHTLLTSGNSTGFTPGSALGLDTASASFTYGFSLGGNQGLAKLGGNTLTLSATNGYLGPTTVLGGTLAVANSGALLGSTLIAPTSGSIVFNPVASHAYSLGGLGGSGNIALQDSAGTAIALSVGGNNADSTYSGA